MDRCGALAVGILSTAQTPARKFHEWTGLSASVPSALCRRRKRQPGRRILLHLDSRQYLANHWIQQWFSFPMAGTHEMFGLNFDAANRDTKQCKSDQ
jgi:hypothetical protein